MAANTVLVLTRSPEKRPEWRAVLRTNLTQAKQFGLQPEIEFFSALMGLMDDVPPSLPADSPYAVVIQAIQNAVSGKAPEPVEEVEPPKEVMNAVHDLLQAKNPHALRKVIEKRQAQLFRPETQDFLASLAQEAQSTGDQQAMQVLVTYAGILQQCQQNRHPGHLRADRPGPASCQRRSRRRLPPGRAGGGRGAGSAGRTRAGYPGRFRRPLRRGPARGAP